MERFQIRIFFGEIAEGAVHLEADLQIRLRIADVAKERFVATHVVIIDRLLQKRDWARDQKFFRFRGFPELVETKPRVQVSRTSIGCSATKFLADAEGESPLFFPHQVMEAKLKNFGAILKARFDGVEFVERLACHAQFCVTAGGLQLPFKLHGFLFSKSLAKGVAALTEFAEET